MKTPTTNARHFILNYIYQLMRGILCRHPFHLFRDFLEHFLNLIGKDIDLIYQKMYICHTNRSTSIICKNVHLLN